MKILAALVLAAPTFSALVRPPKIKDSACDPGEALQCIRFARYCFHKTRACEQCAEWGCY